MTGDDQERFEDYLELERYIEELQAGRAAHPPADLTPERARIYRMAALFRSSVPEAAEPRPEFVVSLHERLLAENAPTDEEVTLPRLPVVRPSEPPAPIQQAQGEPAPITRPPSPRRTPAFSRSRRSLLGGSAIAAASLVVGTGIGAVFEKSTDEQTRSGVVTSTPYPDPGSTQVPMVPVAVAVPYFVTTLAELGSGAVYFRTDTLVGYVILSDGDDSTIPQGEVVAISAACTHMGCIVQWQDTDGNFRCPCHGGIFTEYGEPAKASPIRYLTPLPRLDTLVKDGKVYVMVPGTPSKSTPV